MNLTATCGVGALFLWAASTGLSADQSKVAPPYAGTVFVSPEILRAADPTSFVSISEAGRGKRTMFDRRTNRFDEVDAFVFRAVYRDLPSVLVLVNAEFKDRKLAKDLAEKFARKVGQLPKASRTGVKSLWIHDGEMLFGGGNENILIHTKQADKYEKDSVLEEALLHEAAHSSFDPLVYRDPAWAKARENDAGFISKYALENPLREDVAESFPLFYAVRTRPERLSEEDRQKILGTIPGRLRYFDSKRYELGP
jgi:hypothetical protein